MAYFVYILFAPKDDRFYKGQTNDINNRLAYHNADYEKATKPYIPWKLIWVTKKENRSEALALEKKLKNLSRERLIQFTLKYAESFTNYQNFQLVKDIQARSSR